MQSSVSSNTVTVNHALLEEIVRRMVTVGKPIAIVLFGSHARGDTHSQSDLDLLVIEESDLPRHQRAKKYRNALIGVHPSKDIVVWTPQEVAAWRTVQSAFITTALAEGKVLYERCAKDLVALTDYAVGMRYDFEQWPTKEEARQAMQIAERVRAVVLARCQ
jgi:uncharacterized protein